jgi:hypothetical protein
LFVAAAAAAVGLHFASIQILLLLASIIR